MHTLRLAVSGTVLLAAISCTSDRTPTGPLFAAGSAARATSASGPVDATGHYDAIVDFSTLALTPRGNNCLLEVDGQLVFTGTITGVATAHTSALIFAPCAEVAVTLPGTYRDVFTSRAVFDGAVNGEPAHANLLYQGETNVGGTIDAHLIFSNGMAGALDAVDARVAVGGDYRGRVVVQ